LESCGRRLRPSRALLQATTSVLSVLCTNLHWIGQIVSISNLKLAPTNHGDTTWPTGATCGSCWRVIVKTSFPNRLSCNAQADNRVGHPSLVSYRFRYHKVTIITQSRPFSRLSMQATGVSSLDKNVDSVQWYQVGDAVRESWFDRGDVFISHNDVTFLRRPNAPGNTA
jgi:hypothetical protein